jgi:CheY-like chemotaxis protein
MDDVTGAEGAAGRPAASHTEPTIHTGPSEPAAGPPALTALVADPDPHSAELLCEWLWPRGLEVACTGDAHGAAGLLAGAIVTARPYQVVVCELVWPDGMPPELAAHLWQLTTQGATRTVLTCATGDPATALAAASLDPTLPVLRKPLTSAQLLAAVSGPARRP